MSVSSHLNIRVEEYDARIRTFVPTYEEMISVTAAAMQLLVVQGPTIIDLGVGTGELADRCLKTRPDARVIGIDIDSGMLEVARKRLGGRISLVQGDFQSVQLPKCDAIVACIALHHIKVAGEKRKFYERCMESMNQGGLMISADCFPAREEHLASVQREAWLDHMSKAYPRSEAEHHLESWAAEDFYFPLDDELQWLREADMTTEVVWRQGAFAVVLAKKRS